VTAGIERALRLVRNQISNAHKNGTRRFFGAFSHRYVEFIALLFAPSMWKNVRGTRRGRSSAGTGRSLEARALARMARVTGLEPATSGVTGATKSNDIKCFSVKPAFFYPNEINALSMCDGTFDGKFHFSGAMEHPVIGARRRP
jgi:hypothetical protein